MEAAVKIGQKRFVATVTSKKQVTLPAMLCRHLGLRQGDRIEFILNQDGTIRLTPLRAVPDLRAFVGIWRDKALPGQGRGDAYVEEIRGPVDSED